MNALQTLDVVGTNVRRRPWSHDSRIAHAQGARAGFRRGCIVGISAALLAAASIALVLLHTGGLS